MSNERIAGTFRGEKLLRIRGKCHFVDCSLIPPTVKSILAILPSTITEKTFADRHKTAIFSK